VLAIGLVAAVAAFPAAAGAHSIVRIGGDTVTYLSADATSLNTLTVRMSGPRIELRDRTVDGGIDPGTCDPGEVSDDANAWIVQVLCPAARIARLRIDLGEREDTASVTVPLPVVLLGGPGTDTLRTGAPADELRGGDGNDTLDGGGGNDALDGEGGYDALQGGAGDDRLTSADGLADRVACGAGSDSVEADTGDTVAGDCERVARRLVAPPPDAPPPLDDRTPPAVEAGGSTVQRLRRNRVTLLATSSERGFLAASGFLDVGGVSLPLQSDRRRVTVGGGGARLTVRLSRRQARMCRRALRRGRRARIRMWAVATDLTGNSRRSSAMTIRLRR
jgi:Ca2+-binding RTX toxin-like protein